MPETVQLPFHPASKLSREETHGKVTISCKGSGVTAGTLAWLAFWGTLTLVVVAVFLSVLLAIILGPARIQDCYWVLGILLVLAGVGVQLMFECLESGWALQIVTITQDRISVRYEGKHTPQPYSFPLSSVKKIGVSHNMLQIMFYFRDFRALLAGGTETELEWVEELIRTNMKSRGYRCGYLSGYLD